jgi:hypothetical protein
LPLLGGVLNTCAKYASHANSAISEASMRYSSLLLDCIANKDSDTDDIKELLLGVFDLTALLKCLSIGLNGKSSQGKADARHCCEVLLMCFGEEDLGNAVIGLNDHTKLQVCIRTPSFFFLFLFLFLFWNLLFTSVLYIVCREIIKSFFTLFLLFPTFF